MSALVRCIVANAILLFALAPGFGLIVSGQSTPEPQRYGRDDQDYASQFAEVLTQLDTFWLGNFEETGATYRSPSVIPLEDFVITGCGPAGPEDFAHYCRPDEAIYYSPVALADLLAASGTLPPLWSSPMSGGTTCSG
jgi:predicted metalloprotease